MIFAKPGPWNPLPLDVPLGLIKHNEYSGAVGDDHVEHICISLPSLTHKSQYRGNNTKCYTKKEFSDKFTSKYTEIS